MKTDKELLEFAAKAAGYDIEQHPNRGISKNLHFLLGRNNWNPLTDDGDALRLAVKLELYIFIDGDKVSVDAPTVTVLERFKDCQCAATRRAIVRAAAAIGEKL